MKAWLTLDTIPGATLRRALFVPDHTPWLQCVYGAILLLAEPENWEKYGALTPDQMAAAYTVVLNNLIDRRGHVLDIGEVFFSARGDSPNGCLPCDGSQVAQAQYPALYAAIGAAFGAADVGYFRLPDLRDRSPVGSGLTFARGDNGGADIINLETAQLPAHDHTQPGHTHSVAPHTHGILITEPLVAFTPGELPVASPQVIPSTTAADTGQNTGSGGDENTGETGEAADIAIRNPYIALTAWIVAF